MILYCCPERSKQSKVKSMKCVITVVCVKLGKLYVVKHNCVT